MQLENIRDAETQKKKIKKEQLVIVHPVKSVADHFHVFLETFKKITHRQPLPKCLLATWDVVFGETVYRFQKASNWLYLQMLPDANSAAFAGKARAQATLQCPPFTSFQFAVKMQP